MAIKIDNIPIQDDGTPYSKTTYTPYSRTTYTTYIERGDITCRYQIK